MDTNQENENNFKRIVRIRTLKAFTFFFIGLAGAVGIYFWIVTGPKADRAYEPFRKVMDLNAKIFARSYHNPTPVREFPKQLAASRVRVNGDIGMKSDLDTTKWSLKVVRFSREAPRPSDTLLISLEELRQMPKTEVVFNFKCIEGWSQITWWGGVRFSDLAVKYHLATRDNSIPDTRNHPDALASYCGLITPDAEYYVGIDMPSMMHPQTILCYEMNGQPLPPNQGAPLRLIIPVKYGIKHLKRVGTLFFSDERPPDYWALRGYDYFAGL
jgi:DMSO/TMAO reductase YedYZ molybdopterin-dependent catalytic subunit